MIPQDWNVGDLAVCVDVSPPRYVSQPRGRALIAALQLGRAYRVLEVRISTSPKSPKVPCLRLAGFDYSTGCGGLYAGHDASRFRPLRADEPKACETEFVELLNRSKQPAKVDGPISLEEEVELEGVCREIEWEQDND